MTLNLEVLANFLEINQFFVKLNFIFKLILLDSLVFYIKKRK